MQLLDEALEAAVQLSHRYIPARQLPDKAVSLLDTACARVAISQHATPPEVEDCRRRIEALETELEIIGREEAIGIDTATRATEARRAARRRRKTRLAELEARWKRREDAGRPNPRPARKAAQPAANGRCDGDAAARVGSRAARIADRRPARRRRAADAAPSNAQRSS